MDLKALKAFGIDLADAPAPLVDEAGHKSGEAAFTFLEWLAKKMGLSGIGDLPAPIKAAAPLLIKLVGGAVTVNRNAVPIKGTVGDMVHKLLNTYVDSLSRGLGDAVKDAKKAAEKEAAGKADKAETGDAQLDEMGFVTSKGIWCPSKRCRHFDRPFTQRGQKGPDDISLSEALQADHGVCRQGCYSAADIQRFLAIRGGAQPAPSEPQREEKQKMSETAKPASAPAKTFGQLMAEFRKADPETADGFYEAFEILSRRDPALGEKIREVFSTIGTLDNLRDLAVAPPVRWHSMLDDLRGGSSPVQDGIIRTLSKITGRIGGAATGFVSNEGQQSAEMAMNLTEACEGVKADYVRRSVELDLPTRPDATAPPKGIPLPAILAMSCAALTVLIIVLRHL